MCLGVPGRIVQVRAAVALVDFWGDRREIKLDILTEKVEEGDYVVTHAGYAIRRIPPAEVTDTLAMYEVILCEGGEDPVDHEMNEVLEPVPV